MAASTGGKRSFFFWIFLFGVFCPDPPLWRGAGLWRRFGGKRAEMGNGGFGLRGERFEWQSGGGGRFGGGRAPLFYPLRPILPFFSIL